MLVYNIITSLATATTAAVAYERVDLVTKQISIVREITK
jgi:hypothetical protein